MTALERTIAAQQALDLARETYARFERGRCIIQGTPALWEQYRDRMVEAIHLGDHSTPLARLVEILTNAGYSWDSKAQQWIRS